MIRPYQPTDKEELLTILRLNTPRYFDATEETDFITYLDQHREAYFVVEENGVLLGAGGINYVNEGKTARISWDLFHPNAQGKGLGGQLTRFRIATIQQQPKVEQIIVRTSQLAYGFYEKIGFSLIKIKKDFWAKGFDLYEMEIALV